MRFYEILREYNEARLIKDFGQKIANHYKNEYFPRASKLKNIDNITLPRIVIEDIASEDPTPNKELTFWLCLNYANEGIKRWEDIASRAVPALLKFKALLRKPNLTPPLKIRDINQIKGLSALEELLDQYPDASSRSNAEKDKALEAKFYAEEDASLLLNTDRVKVVVPYTGQASCFFGRGTKWCTAGNNSDNMFNSYNEDGPLYIIMIKGTNEKYQFHFDSEQYVDAKDNEIEHPVDLIRRFPELLDVFAKTLEKIWICI